MLTIHNIEMVGLLDLKSQLDFHKSLDNFDHILVTYLAVCVTSTYLMQSLNQSGVFVSLILL